MKADIPITWKDCLLVHDDYPAKADVKERYASHVVASATSATIGTTLKRNNVRCIGEREFTFTHPQGQPDTNISVNSIWTQDMTSDFSLFGEDELTKDTNLFLLQTSEMKIDAPIGDMLSGLNFSNECSDDLLDILQKIVVVGIGNAYCTGKSFSLSDGEIGVVSTKYDAGNLYRGKLGVFREYNDNILVLSQLSTESPALDFDGKLHKGFDDVQEQEFTPLAIFADENFNVFDISGEYDKDIFTFKNSRISIYGSMIPWPQQKNSDGFYVDQEYIKSFSMDISLPKKGLGEIGNKFAVRRKQFGSPQVSITMDIIATDLGTTNFSQMMNELTSEDNGILQTIMIEVDSRAGDTYMAQISARQASAKYNGQTSAGHSFSLTFESETIPSFQQWGPA